MRMLIFRGDFHTLDRYLQSTFLLTHYDICVVYVNGDFELYLIYKTPAIIENRFSRVLNIDLNRLKT